MPGIKLSERTHPYYDDNIDKWELYKSAVRGGDEFANSDNLWSHRLENTEDYQERLDRAYYLNYCEAVPNIYNTYIFKERVERPPIKEIDQFRKNIDGRENSIATMIAKAGFFSKVFGVIHVLVDMPSAGKSKVSVAEAKTRNLYPFCKLIYPTQLRDWSVDADGNYNWVIIESVHFEDLDPTVERQEKLHYKLITREEWRIEDEDGNTPTFEDGRESSGKNGLGIIPIVTMYHRNYEEDKIGESLLKDIVYVNRTILNWCSCIDEQIERQTFSQLCVPDDGTLVEESETGADPLHRLGTSSAWTFPADANNPPQFISPNVDNIRVIWSLVVDHIKEIFRLAGLVGSTEDMYVSNSGRAAQMGFMGVNSALAETAKKYEQLENKISKLALKQLNPGRNMDEDYEDVKYPDSFDIASLEEEIDAMFKIMERNLSETLNKTLMKDMSRRAVPMALQSVREKIEQEIENGDGIVQSITRSNFGGDVDSNNLDTKSGNPNTNLGKTFRTKGQSDKEKSTHRIEE